MYSMTIHGSPSVKNTSWIGQMAGCLILAMARAS